MPDAEQQELLLAFIEEGNELLDESEPLLIELETKSNESGEVDGEVINTIFRLYHSLKGGAGFLDLDTVGKVTHVAETLLDLFRKGKGSISSDHVDILNKTCDFLRKLLNNIETNFTDAGFEDEAEDIIHDLKKKIEGITGEAGESAPQKPAEPAAKEADTSESSHAEEKPGEPTEVPSDMQLTITPEMVKQFTAEAEDMLTATEEAFLILDKDPTNQEQLGEAFRALHSFKGNAGFFGYGDLEKLSHQAETALDKIRLGEIGGDSQLFSLLLEILDFLRDGVEQAVEGRQPTIAALPGLTNLLQGNVARLESIKAKKPKGEPQADKPEKASESNEAKERVKKPAPQAKKTAPKANSKATAPAPARKAAQRQSIRVDIEKLEMLLDLVGELVIAEAMVAQNPDLKELLNVSLDRFEKSASHLNKITRDLQDIATSIRMIPLSATFRRMIRLVRDLAHKTGKKVDLEIIGEEIEVDKTVIEKITDPLVHMIRNSIDHGIATPESRKKLGKPETGHLLLEAKYVGGEVWISIKDDGQGLNREKILERAIEKGLVEGDGLDIPDAQIWQLIFQPGFSTAEKVTAVSGRGVGMDVVRRNIEDIRGKVDIVCVPGEGTEVILRIPLTLAIIDGMLIRVGRSLYIIPIIAIRETIKAKYKDITTMMDGQEIINIRGNLYPIVRLHEFYGIEPSSTELTEGILMIVENAGRRFCLFVDELIGQQQIVIKGLSEYIGQVKAISGCTILGDGKVCLIIDIATLADRAEQGKNAVAQTSIQDAVVSVG
ncbi:chemotaxis protein CheA [candidate division KSB1 bacterium]|nr:chemotaxis protein CheA [candidate division KSB1 bacterium]